MCYIRFNDSWYPCVQKYQVENEYGNVEWAYGVGGELYVKWAAETAVSLNTSVPWVMCAQDDAPDPIVRSYHIIEFCACFCKQLC